MVCVEVLIKCVDYAVRVGCARCWSQGCQPGHSAERRQEVIGAMIVAQ